MKNTEEIRVGDYVICINAKVPKNLEITIKEGEVFKIAAKSNCPKCHHDTFILEGVNEQEDEKICTICGSNGFHSGEFLTFRFKPFSLNILSNHDILKNQLDEKLDCKFPLLSAVN